MCTVYSSCDHTTNTIYINTTVEVEKIVEVRITLLPLPKISTSLQPCSHKFISNTQKICRCLWRSRRSSTNGARMILLVIVPRTGVLPDTLIATSHTHGVSLFMDTKTTKCPSSLVVLASFWNMVVIRLGYASTITSVVIPTFVGFTMR